MSSETRDHRRAAERVEMLGDLQGEVKIFQPISIKELSVAGVQVESRFPLQLDSLHEFRLTLGRQSIIVHGRIVHSRISEVAQDQVFYRSGVQFVEIPARIRGAIASFIEELKAARAGS